MNGDDVFWKLEALSDRQLLERLGSALGSSRRLMAELLAHLGEVEERRLHLVAACSSMFAYCLKLGMTEDEAYRRIEVARLARRYPTIFPLLANGRLTISAAALLKHYLSDENHLERLASAAGKSVVQTRELIAARFLRPDVASSVRKLPERRARMRLPLASSMPIEALGAGTEPNTGGTEPSVGRTASSMRGTEPLGSGTEPLGGGTEPLGGGTQPGMGGKASPSGTESREHETGPSTGSAESCRDGRESCRGGRESCTGSTESCRGRTEPCSAALAGTTQPSHSHRVTPPGEPSRVAPSRVEPLSAQRYKVQFTAGAELARKLALAKDLLRHCHPGGELGPIVERALDLLIESVMQRRFGTRKKASLKRASARAVHGELQQRSDVIDDPSETRSEAEPTNNTHDTAKPGMPEPTNSTQRTAPPDAPWSSATVWVAAGWTSTACVVARKRGSSTIIVAPERKAAARNLIICDSFVELITASLPSESTDEARRAEHCRAEERASASRAARDMTGE